MNKILNHILVIFICSNVAVYAMEQQEQVPTPSAGSSSSSSSSKMPKKSILKNPAREKEAKGNIRFELNPEGDTPESQGNIPTLKQDAPKPVPRASDEEWQAYQEEQRGIVKSQRIAVQERLNATPEAEAVANLISFAQTTIPEVEEIIKSCAKDMVEVWNFFNEEPTDVEMAKRNFEKLRFHFQHYERNIVSKISKTGKETQPLLAGYAKILDALKRPASYQFGANADVEALDDMLSLYMDSIKREASSLYTQSEKKALDAIFSKIDSNLADKEEYQAAVLLSQASLDNIKNLDSTLTNREKYEITEQLGHTLLDDIKKIEDAINQEKYITAAQLGKRVLDGIIKRKNVIDKEKYETVMQLGQTFLDNMQKINRANKEKYVTAVALGHKFLDDITETENAVDRAMTNYSIRKYSRDDYSTLLYYKGRVDKEMAIERVWPYARKIESTKQSLLFVL
jgi:hypothetical protein